MLRCPCLFHRRNCGPLLAACCTRMPQRAVLSRVAPLPRSAPKQVITRSGRETDSRPAETSRESESQSRKGRGFSDTFIGKTTRVSRSGSGFHGSSKPVAGQFPASAERAWRVRCGPKNATPNRQVRRSLCGPQAGKKSDQRSQVSFGQGLVSLFPFQNGR